MSGRLPKDHFNPSFFTEPCGLKVFVIFEREGYTLYFLTDNFQLTVELIKK